jgi:hypothetical protein
VRMVTRQKGIVSSMLLRMCEAGMKAIVECLKKKIAILDRQIAAMIKETPLLRAKAELLLSAPGMGRVVSATIIARLPELGTAASLAGRPRIPLDLQRLIRTMSGCGRVLVQVTIPNYG